ncbi:borealin [Clupea harengus]|uniref:Borealin n=1 Tax=Clupea harengus TaxID=7950 RepID=A0A6P8GW35_CLUHA|nr:borealin [Clupea harengus]
MAPRKRTTNKKQKNDPKTAKLEAFLADFDGEVQSIVERLKERTNNLLKDADHLYNMALIKLPKVVRQMNWVDFCASEKPKSPAVDEKKDAEEAAKVESTLAEDHTKSTKKSMKTQSRVKSDEHEEGVPPKSTVKKVGRPKKVPSTSQKNKKGSVLKQNGTIRKSAKKPLYTPARSFMETSLMGATPLITPRFDARLPKTPAVRNPRHREKVYSISVNGSPIAGGSEDIVINVPLGNGEYIQLLASEMDSVDLSQLDENTIRNMRQLQSRLTTLCGSSK